MKQLFPITSRLGLRRAAVAALAAALVAVACRSPCRAQQTSQADRPLAVVVMDPLAAPLACSCIEGYAQRKYELLAVYLEKKLGRRVELVFSEALVKALSRTGGRADLVIGKQSVVQFDAAVCRRKLRPIARLTGKDGATTHTGLFVVPADDPARTIAGLKGYRIVFGLKESAEKHSAAMAALGKAGVPLPEKLATAEACSEGAFAVLEHKQPPGAAAVISSYSLTLLEGCGALDKGALRVIGHTDPVPFITAFVNESLRAELQKKLAHALLTMRGHPGLLLALETKEGFTAVAAQDKDAPKDAPKGAPGEQTESSSSDWPQWRGRRRDASAVWLPQRLGTEAKFVWKKQLTGHGLSGVAVGGGCVIVADRGPLDQQDVFRCLDAASGRQLWSIQYLAPGDLDYGNSPRATPLIHRGKVYLLGAFGDLHCVNLADGKIVWKKSLMGEFGAKLVTWGMTASPLLVDGRLIVNPGAKAASLVALDPETGKLVWQCPGLPAAYSSFIVAEFGGVRQIVGYDSISLGGWEIAGGKRLWRLLPAEQGDFNVPTPINAGGRVLVTTENNGTRLYDFDDQGKIVPQPAAEFMDLAPDMHTPVVTAGRVFGVCGELFCLDLNNGLKPLWTAEDEAFQDYVSIITCGDRLLITSVTGELLLVGAGGEKFELISRLKLFAGDTEVLSHPALAGRRLYVRDTMSVACVALDEQ